jgi:hypothetical protein
MSRVSTTNGSTVQEEAQQTPTPASTAFADLPTLTTASYQQQMQVQATAPPPAPAALMQLSQPPMMDISSVSPAYSAALPVQLDPRRHHQQLYAARTFPRCSLPIHWPLDPHREEGKDYKCKGIVVKHDHQAS